MDGLGELHVVQLSFSGRIVADEDTRSACSANLSLFGSDEVAVGLMEFEPLAEEKYPRR